MMTPRRRNKIQIISIISVSLSIIIFVVGYIIFSSKLLLKNFDFVKEYDFPRIYFDKGTTKAVLTQILSSPKSEAFYGEKLVHLDLKGAPPSISYLREFFPFIKKFGATGVLIEYEDMFYYKEDLKDIRALNAYQPSEIKTILELAYENNLSVIPLIQAFGHLEFILKLEKFKDLREIKEYPQVLCPNHEKALSIVKKMIDQILEAHPNAKYIHIGCDEVLYLGECDKCKSAMRNNSWLTSELFLNHVKNIASYINKTYSGVRPIMWDDMIGRCSENLLIKSRISSLVDLMVWKYVPNVSDYITNDLLSMYARVFKSIWIASAFKGATGVNQIITDVKYHLANHIAWMKIVSHWKNSINFKGIALTGWQRYDHFAELCELLPVAIPSLAVNLHFLKGSENEKPSDYRLLQQSKSLVISNTLVFIALIFIQISASYFTLRCIYGDSENDLLEILQCNPLSALSPAHFDFFTEFKKCNFPGYLVYELVSRFHNLSSKIKTHFSIVYGGWFSVVSVVHKFSSPAYVKNIFDKWPIDENLKELKALEDDIKSALFKVYDKFTVEEWITNNVTPIRLRLEAFYLVKEAMLGRDVWPRRPLLNNTDDLERAAKKICSSDTKFGCALLLI